MNRTIPSLLCLCLASAVASAQETVETQIKHDVVLRALIDELERNRSGLTLEGLERPYFIEYELVDSHSIVITAQLGAVSSKAPFRARQMRTDVRVGSYHQDNTNFRGGGGGGAAFDADMPIEDDYNAIRQAIWWDTDRTYRYVVEAFAEKKAFMETKVIEDKPDDFSRETPAVFFEDRIDFSLPADKLEQTALTLTNVFRDYPHVQNSNIYVIGYHAHKYLVNTEGARLRTSHRLYSIMLQAGAQADDGMPVSDSLTVHARRFEDLPPLDELTQECRNLADRLLAVKRAPALNSYTGPVLFEAEAAASLFLRHFGSRFPGGQRPVGSRSNPEDFANKINKRILPRFVHVVDDPTRDSVAGSPVMGNYLYDDQAVKAQPVTLVDAGRLKTQVMSRNPSKELKRSTGHGRGANAPRAAIGCLIVTADPALNAQSLKAELLEACQDEGLEYGIRVGAVGGAAPGARSGGEGGGSPLLLYKVFPEGREELVRGAEFARIDLKAFKRIVAMGDTPYVHNSGGPAAYTVAAPAMLFEELDLAKIDRDFDKPPILPSPVARAKSAD